MPKQTRLERAEQRLKNEQHASDIRRLKKAVEYFDKGIAELNMQFYDTNHNTVVCNLIRTIEQPLKAITTITGQHTLLDERAE